MKLACLFGCKSLILRSIMNRRKIVTKEDALRRIAEIGVKMQRNKKDYEEILKEIKAIQYDLKKSDSCGTFEARKPEEYKDLNPSSTIGKVAAVYIEFCREKSTYSPSTINNYSSNLSSIEKLLGRRIGISGEEFMKIYDEAIGNVSKSTYANRLSAFRNMFNWAAENGIINSIPKI